MVRHTPKKGILKNGALKKIGNGRKEEPKVIRSPHVNGKRISPPNKIQQLRIEIQKKKIEEEEEEEEGEEGITTIDEIEEEVVDDEDELLLSPKLQEEKSDDEFEIKKKKNKRKSPGTVKKRESESKALQQRKQESVRDLEKSLIQRDDVSGPSSERGTTYTAVSEYQKQKNFASILDNLCKIGLEAVIVISDRGVILRANPTALQLTEYLQDELINRKINKLLPKYHRERHDGYLLRYTRTLCPVILNRVREGYHIVRKARYPGEVEAERKIPVALKTTEIVDQNGQRYFVGVLRDDRVYQYNNIHSDIVKRMYPASIYKRVMKKDGSVIHGKDNMTCVFVDLVGFSSHCKTLSTEDVVVMLNRFFEVMDRAVMGRGRFIKTIGDCYMYVCGLQCCEHDDMVKHMDHAGQAIEIGLDALRMLKETKFELKVRIGVCSGTAIFGVFGSSIPTFDVFGEVVNIASRMEKVATPNRVTVFSNVQRLTANFYEFEQRVVGIKGFPGEHVVYDVLQRKEADSIYDIAL